jgi:hypothetical protein
LLEELQNEFVALHEELASRPADEDTGLGRLNQQARALSTELGALRQTLYAEWPELVDLVEGTSSDASNAAHGANNTEIGAKGRPGRKDRAGGRDNDDDRATIVAELRELLLLEREQRELTAAVAAATVELESEAALLQAAEATLADLDVDAARADYDARRAALEVEVQGRQLEESGSVVSAVVGPSAPMEEGVN